MTRVEKRLKAEARKAATGQGHSMGRWDKVGRSHRLRCKDCGRGAFVTLNPMANEIDICGEAVVVGCLEHPAPRLKDNRMVKAQMCQKIGEYGVTARFIANVIMNQHSRPTKKLRCLLGLLETGHEVRLAQFSTDIVIVDGERYPWDIMESPPTQSDPTMKIEIQQKSECTHGWRLIVNGVVELDQETAATCLTVRDILQGKPWPAWDKPLHSIANRIRENQKKRSR